MKFKIPALVALALLSLAPLARATVPTPCSVSVGIVPRTGLVFRTYANPFEVGALEGLGLAICQNDARTAEDPTTHMVCNTEFYLQLLYSDDQMTRVLTLFRNGDRIFSQNYDGYMMSQKIMKTLPTCAELKNLPVLGK